MNTAKGFEMHEAMCNQELATRTRKAKDYSSDADILSNFRCQAAIFKALADNGMQVDITTMDGVAMALLILKIVRWQNLVQQRNGLALNEAMFDTALDARVYMELARECYAEREMYEALQRTSTLEDYVES